MAGPFYSTRSKTKRNSQSDADSSRSQSRQPPYKRRTRQGARQAGKSAKFNNMDTTSYSNVVVTNTNHVSTPAEIALHNDLVLETLFKYLNRSDLLSCRVVNKQWQYEATKELRRRKLVIRFSFSGHGNQRSRNIAVQNICRSLSKCKTPSLLSSFQVKTVAPFDLGSAQVGSIFSAVGNHLKNLTLHLNYLSKRSCFERSSLMTHLQNLLVHQAPNLEFLEIKVDFPFHWKDVMQGLDSTDQPFNDENEFGVLPNLKIFNVRGSLPPKIFADVINAAVNLRSFGGAWSACRQYLMGAEGEAKKIHQLKSLQLAVYSRDSCNKHFLEEMETFLAENKQNLKLETFECVFELVYENPSSAPRTVSVVNQILECSSGSLLKLSIEPAKWFDDLLIIPHLPILQEICFDCFRGRRFGLGDGGRYFPPGFNMSHSFPNVSSIVLLRCTPSLFHLFVKRIEIEIKEPVPSIRRIIMIDTRKDGISVPLIVNDFHHVFPNLLSISYVVDSDNYNRI